MANSFTPSFSSSVKGRIAAVDETRKAGVDLVRYREGGALVRRPPVTCDPDAAVAEAAALMARERVSSLLIPFGAITKVELVWAWGDLMNALQVFPSIIGVIGLSGLVARVASEK